MAPLPGGGAARAPDRRGTRSQPRRARGLEPICASRGLSRRRGGQPAVASVGIDARRRDAGGGRFDGRPLSAPAAERRVDGTRRGRGRHGGGHAARLCRRAIWQALRRASARRRRPRSPAGRRQDADRRAPPLPKARGDGGRLPRPLARAVAERARSGELIAAPIDDAAGLPGARRRRRAAVGAPDRRRAAGGAAFGPRPSAACRRRFPNRLAALRHRAAPPPPPRALAARRGAIPRRDDEGRVEPHADAGVGVPAALPARPGVGVPAAPAAAD